MGYRNGRWGEFGTPRYIAPLPRVPPSLFVRDRHLEAERDLALAGLLITPFPRRRAGPTYAEALTAIEERLLAAAGQLKGEAVWIEPTEGPAPATIESETWLRRRAFDSATVAILLPRPER